jgi:glycosyltransferase involved in cell wall biosynthesis
LLGAGRRLRTELQPRLDTFDATLLVAPGMLASLASRRLVRRGRPYGVEVVGDPYDAMAPGTMRHPLRPLLRWSAARDLRRVCARAAAASYVTGEALQRRYPCGGPSVGVSDVELPADAFAAAPRTADSFGVPARAAIGMPRSAAAFTPAPRRRPCTIVSVGTMAQLYKAQDVLIDAVATCLRTGVNVRLVLVGDGRHRAALAARADANGIGARVAFLGAVAAGAAVRRVLDDADLFVLASHQEGLPRAMVEAMARGLPCIGSTDGGIPELLPGEDLVPPGDAAALATAIRGALADPERLARMSARNLEVARGYREELLNERRLAFYEHLRRMTAAGAARAA